MLVFCTAIISRRFKFGFIYSITNIRFGLAAQIRVGIDVGGNFKSFNSYMLIGISHSYQFNSLISSFQSLKLLGVLHEAQQL